MAGVTYQKILVRNKNERKRKLLTEFALSLDGILDEVKPWFEMIDGKEFELKKIQNVANFGVLHLVFEEKNNPENTIRLPLHMGLDNE
jgi:hypothetical protein